MSEAPRFTHLLLVLAVSVPLFVEGLSVDDIQKQARAAATVLGEQISTSGAGTAVTEAAGTDWDDYKTKDTFKKLKEEFEEAKKKLDKQIVKIERDYTSLLELVDSEIKDATQKEETVQMIKGSMWNIKQVFEAKKLVGKEHKDEQAQAQQQQAQQPPGGAMGAGQGQMPAPLNQMAPGGPEGGTDLGDDSGGGGGKKGKGGGGKGRKKSSKKSSKKGKGKHKGKNRGRSHRKNKKHNDRGKRKRG